MIDTPEDEVVVQQKMQSSSSQDEGHDNAATASTSLQQPPALDDSSSTTALPPTSSSLNESSVKPPSSLTAAAATTAESSTEVAVTESMNGHSHPTQQERKNDMKDDPVVSTADNNMTSIITPSPSTGTDLSSSTTTTVSETMAQPPSHDVSASVPPAAAAAAEGESFTSTLASEVVVEPKQHSSDETIDNTEAANGKAAAAPNDDAPTHPMDTAEPTAPNDGSDETINALENSEAVSEREEETSSAKDKPTEENLQVCEGELLATAAAADVGPNDDKNNHNVDDSKPSGLLEPMATEESSVIAEQQQPSFAASLEVHTASGSNHVVEVGEKEVTTTTPASAGAMPVHDASKKSPNDQQEHSSTTEVAAELLKPAPPPPPASSVPLDEEESSTADIEITPPPAAQGGSNSSNHTSSGNIGATNQHQQPPLSSSVEAAAAELAMATASAQLLPKPPPPPSAAVVSQQAPPPPAAAPQQAPAAPSATAAPEVIDLLDDDDDDDDDDYDGKQSSDMMDVDTSTSRPNAASEMHQSKRQKLSNSTAMIQPGSALGHAAAAARPIPPTASSMQHIQHPTSTSSYGSRPPTSYGSPPRSTHPSTAPGSGSPSLSSMHHMDRPQYMRLPEGFVPTWQEFWPRTKPSPAAAAAAYQQRSGGMMSTSASGAMATTMPRRDRRRYFQLSLLNVNEFTITGLPVSYTSYPTPVAGLRTAIRQISREHGKAVFERYADVTNADELAADDGEEIPRNRAEGKWRIPLGAYHAFVAYLKSDAYTQVEGIPQHQLQIASLAREREAKGYPSVETLIERGVPTRLAQALAPFQRGGVDFVLDKNGRALVADDMGLGKTIQGIASMSVYHKEWPLLVLCPSSARYHWEAEFQHWLGTKSHLKSTDEQLDFEGASDPKEERKTLSTSPKREEMILNDSQIHVLTSSKAAILPRKDTKVVICSYGLAPLLVKNQAIVKGLFKCCIVDESHMLKNIKTKRTSALVPILNATDRCVLLSGTPALARPGELWPQLSILGTQKYGWWEDEAEFMDKYVRKSSARRRAELHTMLSGTVMIRRLKADILKTLPKKKREKANLHVISSEGHRDEFKHLLKMLRKGKGAMGKLARKQHAEDKRSTETEEVYQPPQDPNAPPTADQLALRREEAERALRADVQKRFADGRAIVEEQVDKYSQSFGEQQTHAFSLQLDQQLRTQLEGYHQQEMAKIHEQYGKQKAQPQETERTAVLSRLYALTGEVKIPLVVDMLNRWLNDPTKGKICIFAHHISVLDAIGERAGLSNDAKSTRKFIRIDGSTSPKLRQQQITTYQTDPSVRVALLGITAAGVAVTLTACSTVWFAELFWTPAIMIQAEDRCHRIGQQARVKCLYFVARGTVDDVLWKLIEKKFQDLGEFVEGKEKLKMVVDHTYAHSKELFSMFQTPARDSGDESESEEDEDLKNLLMDDDLEKDIEALGEEERQLLRAVDAVDEDGDQTSPSNKSDDEKNTTLVIDDDDDDDDDDVGRTEDAAITLSDDDDDGDAKPAAKQPAPVAGVPVVPGSSIGSGVAAAAPRTDQITKAPPLAGSDSVFTRKLTRCRLYQMFFQGPSLGLEIVCFQGRVVVAKVNEDWKNKPHAKPASGDVLVAVNGQPLPLVPNLMPAREQIRRALQFPPVLIAFAEDPEFHDVFKRRFASGLLPLPPPPPSAVPSSSSNAMRQEAVVNDLQQGSAAAATTATTAAPLPPPPPSAGADDVIELLDDSSDDES